MGGGELTSEDTEQCTKLLSFPPLDKVIGMVRAFSMHCKNTWITLTTF